MKPDLEMRGKELFKDGTRRIKTQYLKVMETISGDTYSEAEMRQSFMKLDRFHEDILSLSDIYRAVKGGDHVDKIALQGTGFTSHDQITDSLMRRLFHSANLSGDVSGINFPEYARTVMDDTAYWDTLMKYSEKWSAFFSSATKSLQYEADDQGEEEDAQHDQVQSDEALNTFVTQRAKERTEESSEKKEYNADSQVDPKKLAAYTGFKRSVTRLLLLFCDEWHKINVRPRQPSKPQDSDRAQSVVFTDTVSPL